MTEEEKKLAEKLGKYKHYLLQAQIGGIGLFIITFMILGFIFSNSESTQEKLLVLLVVIGLWIVWGLSLLFDLYRVRRTEQKLKELEERQAKETSASIPTDSGDK